MSTDDEVWMDDVPPRTDPKEGLRRRQHEEAKSRIDADLFAVKKLMKAFSEAMLKPLDMALEDLGQAFFTAADEQDASYWRTKLDVLESYRHDIATAVDMIVMEADLDQ